MLQVLTSSTFDAWLGNLRDEKGRGRILARIGRVAAGNFGDIKPIGEGLSEMRIDVGPGYRIYFMQKGQAMVILLCGGDKSSQKTDIKEAKRIAAQFKE